MIYKNQYGKMVDTSNEVITCPWCHKIISKEEIDNDDVYHDGTSNDVTGEDWCELLHENCAEEADEDRRDKCGY